MHSVRHTVGAPYAQESGAIDDEKAYSFGKVPFGGPSASSHPVVPAIKTCFDLQIWRKRRA